MRRRDLLTVAGLSATTSTVGGLDAVLDRQEIRLARFSVDNFDTTSHRFDLRVDRDGETVHRSSFRIQGKGENRVYGEVADCDWGTTPGEYEVFARADGADWTSKSLDDVTEGWRETADCATAHAIYFENGNFWLRLQDDCERFVPTPSTGVCTIDDQTDE